MIIRSLRGGHLDKFRAFPVSFSIILGLPSMFTIPPPDWLIEPLSGLSLDDITGPDDIIQATGSVRPECPLGGKWNKLEFTR